MNRQARRRLKRNIKEDEAWIRSLTKRQQQIIAIAINDEVDRTLRNILGDDYLMKLETQIKNRVRTLSKSLEKDDVIKTIRDEYALSGEEANKYYDEAHTSKVGAKTKNIEAKLKEAGLGSKVTKKVKQETEETKKLDGLIITEVHGSYKGMDFIKKDGVLKVGNEAFENCNDLEKYSEAELKKLKEEQVKNEESIKMLETEIESKKQYLEELNKEKISFLSKVNGIADLLKNMEELKNE